MRLKLVTYNPLTASGLDRQLEVHRELWPAQLVCLQGTKKQAAETGPFVGRKLSDGHGSGYLMYEWGYGKGRRGTNRQAGVSISVHSSLLRMAKIKKGVVKFLCRKFH